MEKALVVNEKDNVATAIANLSKGESVAVRIGDRRDTFTLIDDIPFGHKFAIKPIGSGDLVVKYGLAIGGSTESIASGAHVHTHNVRSLRGAVK
jgi:altronate dehydratase small subunit